MFGELSVRRLACGLAAVLGLMAVDAALVGAATAAPSPAPPLAGPGGIGLRLVEVPLSARDDPRAQLYIVDHLAPGDVIRRRIEVTNSTPDTVDIVLYSAAASIADGSFLGSVGLTPNDLSTWTSVVPGKLTVPAGEQVTATVTIDLPDDAAPGEQYGVVWAEARSAATEGVTQVNRVGIRLYLSVGPGGPPRPDFAIKSLTATRTAEGRPAVLATVHNTGGRALDMSGSLRLSDGPGGLSAGPFPATLGVTLAVGATESVTIALDPQIPNGPWEAELTLRSGLLERSGAAVITFPVAGAAPAVPATAVRPAWLYPTAGLVLLVMCLAALYLALRRRLRRLRAAPVAARHAADERPAAVPVSEFVTPVLPVTERTERPERRRAIRQPAAPVEEPLTVDDIIGAPFHWEIALPGSRDPLTDLANRSLFVDETQFAIDKRGADRVCLMLVNLDDFHAVNDMFGADGGNAVLVSIAERLRRGVRPQDLVARLDGDEFAVLFEDVEHADVNTIAQRLLRTVREPLSLGGHRVQVEASVGVAPLQATDDAGLLMEHAAAALAEAKITTRAGYSWYTGAAGPASA